MKKRPINLNLLTLKFPISSIISILHRISGVILFFLIPGLLCLLDDSLKSQAGFDQVAHWFSSIPAQVLLWGFLAALVYHLFAGIRHLLMDIGWGESLSVSRKSSCLVLVVTLLVTIGLGVCL